LTPTPTSRLAELLAALVAQPTVAGASNEALVAYVSAQLAEAGVPSTPIPSTRRPDGLNLHAVIGPAQKPGVLLSGHTDVVSVEGQAWSSDPFTLTTVGNRLYGRGTTDMKGFVAAILAVVPRAANQPLRRPLHIALSCDEELGCLGVGSLIDHLTSYYPPPLCAIVGEPTRMRVADRHKGKVALRAQVRGHTLHSCAAPKGVNAVTYAARLISAIDDIARELLAEPPEPGDAGFAVPQATLSIGPIQGGVSTNIVPEHCTFDFELRYGAERDPVAPLARIRERAAALEAEMRHTAPETGITLSELGAYPPLAASAGGVRLPHERGSDHEPARTAVDFGTEAGLYSRAFAAPILICGPGDMARAHRADEYIELGELEEAELMLRGVVDSLCI
jgi:acetylornithine deacetylase